MEFEALEELLPSEEDVAFYQEHGWYISKKILPDDLLDEAAYGCERYYRGERDNTIPRLGEWFDWRPERGEVLRENFYVSLRNNEIGKLVRTPIIGAIASRLTGSPQIRLFRDTLLWKPPAKGASQTQVGWHVDRAYWLSCTSDNMLTAWVPLHDCDERMGTLTILDRSHKWPNNFDMRTSHNQDQRDLLSRFDTSGQPIVEVPLNLRKGQVSFHHCRTAHASQLNLTDKPRVAVAIHMQDMDNRYRALYNPDGSLFVHLNDLVCRSLKDGSPDYTDPSIFPVLWTEKNERRQSRQRLEGQAAGADSSCRARARRNP